MRAKVTRRFQVTIPQDVREKVDLTVGDLVEVRCEGDKIVIEKLGENWAGVMDETAGTWRKHPIFREMKNSIEIVNWLRGKTKSQEGKP